MQNLARIVVDAAVFLAESSDEVVNPDAAVQMLESLSAELQHASSHELGALKSVIEDRLAIERVSSVRAFLHHFFETMGLPKPPPE